MWFLFGLITLVGFSIYSAHKHFNAAWKGATGYAGESNYQYKILKNRFKTTGLLVGIDGPEGYDFTLKKEAFIDRLFKRIKLSQEHQVGSKEFDDLVYVVSDNSQLHRQLSSNAAITDAVIDAFNSSKALHCEVKEIRSSSGRLWIKYRTKSGFNEDIALHHSAGSAKILQKIASEIEPIPQSATKKWRDPFVLKAALILAVSSGMLINGLVQFGRIIWTNTPFIIDATQLWIDAVFWASCIIGALIVGALVALGRSARTHLVLIELLLVGSLGAVLTTYSQLRDINMDLDSSMAEQYDAVILEMKNIRRRRSNKHYIYLDDWNEENKIKKVKVSKRFYQTVLVGEKLSIKQKQGYLNYRWVEQLERKAQQ